MNLNEYIGLQIKKNRINHNMTQDDLANKLNTTRQTISRYENGDRKTTQYTLFELSKLFNTSVDFFFPKTESKKKEKNTTNLLAAHIDENVTDEQMNKITEYIDFITRNNEGDKNE